MCLLILISVVSLVQHRGRGYGSGFPFAFWLRPPEAARTLLSPAPHPPFPLVLLAWGCRLPGRDADVTPSSLRNSSSAAFQRKRS